MSILRKIRNLFSGRRRPIYGDVHITITGDSAQFAAGMARAKESSERLSRRLDGLGGIS